MNFNLFIKIGYNIKDNFWQSEKNASFFTGLVGK